MAKSKNMWVDDFLAPVKCLILGSNVIYDDSMNLRNILWLAPLPSDTPESWAAPGNLLVHSALTGKFTSLA